MSKLQSFNFSQIQKVPYHVVDRYCPHIQDFQDCLRRIFGIVRSPSFPTVFDKQMSDVLKFTNTFFQKVFFFLDYLKYLGVSKIRHEWLWKPLTRPRGPTIVKIRGFRVSQNEIEKVLVQNEAR